MKTCHRALPLLFLVGLLGLPGNAATASFTDQIATIARNEAVELERLADAMSGATSQTELISLQRCASYVKLSSRLALCQLQLDLTPQDPAAAARLSAMAEKLDTRLEALSPALPEGYRFAPLGDHAPEVPACDE